MSRTFESTMREVETLEKEEAALAVAAKTQPGAARKMAEIGGKAQALRAVAGELEAKEKQEFREAAASAVPVLPDGGRPRDAEGRWVDPRTGREFRSLTPDERIAPHDTGLSLGRALRAMATNDWHGAEAEQRALSTFSGVAGGYLVPSELSGYVIDLARADSVCVQAGVRTVPFTDDGVGNTLTLARVTADPSVAWVAEAGAITPSDPTFGAVTLTANKLVCIIKASRELLADAPNAAEVIERTVASAMAAEIDRAILEGSGAGAEPTGLAIHADVTEVSMGDNGALPTNGASGTAGAPKLLACHTAIRGANHTPTAIISSPRTFGTFAGLVDSTYQPLNLPVPVARLPWLTTTNVSDVREQGSSGAVCSNAYVADWARGMLGIRQQIEVYQTRDIFLTTDEVAFLITWRGDFQPEDPTAFCRLVGIKAA